MRYRISYNAVSQIVFGLMGAGPSKGWAEIRPEEIYGQMGWTGNVTIPRKHVASVERLDHAPWWLGFGVHGMFGTWALNGAARGAVKVTMRKSAKAKGRVLFVPIRPHTIYFSLEQPGEFVYEATQGDS